MKPTGQLMLVSGNQLAPKSKATSPNHWPTGFPLQVFPLSFSLSFFQSIENYFPLDYVATYPADGIVYRSSDMILCAHTDASFLNETNSRSQVGAHIFLSENDPFPHFNGAVLSIAKIIKFVMASAAKSEIAALFITARKIHCHGMATTKNSYPN